jgi:hypothetical protein
MPQFQAFEKAGANAAFKNNSNNCLTDVGKLLTVR